MVKLLRFRSQQNPLNHRLQSATSGGTDTDQKPKQMKKGFTVARHDDTEHHRQQREVNLPSLLLACDQKRKNCGEERRRCADGLVEGDEEVAEGGVAADDGEVEDCAESEDLEELLLGVDVLEQNEFKEVDGGVGISGA